MKCPCRGCTDRTVTCHGVCKRYQEWKKEHEDEKAWLKAQMPMTSEGVKKRVSYIAPVFVYPGEDELTALALNAYRAMIGEQEIKEYV